VRVTLLRVRDFRSYSAAQLRLGDGITVIQGRNGAGKTNLIEALYLGCTGRSFRTANEREAIRFGERVARVELEGDADDGLHSISLGLATAEPKRIRVDGSPVERLADVPVRPLASVFAPDRLELVKAGPALRRAHLDQVVAALWPARSKQRRAYARALVQRNALLARMRARAGGGDALPAWDAELAWRGIELMASRREAVAVLAPRFASVAGALGLEGDSSLVYRPRSNASTREQLAAELRERREADLSRGFTGHGPHRDELLLSLGGRELRTYGSQGEQRLALLALLVAEREAIARARQAPPLMLLDDAMSELDGERRRRLVELLGATGGQSVITSTELDQVPGARDPSVTRVTVADGAVLEAAGGRAAA
jgi:DNA replication and repair protein RecF